MSRPYLATSPRVDCWRVLRKHWYRSEGIEPALVVADIGRGRRGATELPQCRIGVDQAVPALGVGFKQFPTESLKGELTLLGVAWPTGGDEILEGMVLPAMGVGVNVVDRSGVGDIDRMGRIGSPNSGCTAVRRATPGKPHEAQATERSGLRSSDTESRLEQGLGPGETREWPPSPCGPADPRSSSLSLRPPRFDRRRRGLRDPARGDRPAHQWVGSARSHRVTDPGGHPGSSIAPDRGDPRILAVSSAKLERNDRQRGVAKSACKRTHPGGGPRQGGARLDEESRRDDVRGGGPDR